jgi:hypothetical protein
MKLVKPSRFDGRDFDGDVTGDKAPFSFSGSRVRRNVSLVTKVDLMKTRLTDDSCIHIL